MRAWSRRAAATMALSLALLACSGAPAPQPAASGPSVTATSVATPSAAPSQAAATPTVRPSTTPGPGDVVYDGRIDVGNGRKLEVRCVGIGSPTILLEGGGTEPTLDAYPRAFVNELGKTTTTCQYSHAGAGTSTPLPGTRTMEAVVGDAYALLAALREKAGVQGPFLFVGWSFGGAVALAEALAHPDQTAALIILDTDFVTEFMSNCLRSGRTKADCQQEYQDDIDAKSLEAELLPRIHPLPDIPMRIVSAMQLPDCDPSKPETLTGNVEGRILKAKDCPALAKLFGDEQNKGWSTVQPKLKQTRVDADHDGLIDQAGREIRTLILELVEEVRANP